MKNVLVIFVLLVIGCQKTEIKSDTSECMREKIISYQKSKLPCKSGKSVYRYFFNDRNVYVFNPGDCGADMMSEVYDENCNLICGLGGIAGNLTCENLTFWKEAKQETLIWED